MTTTHANPDKAHGPKFTLDIEGTLYTWDHDTITATQVRQLASIPDDQTVMLIDADNNERQLDDRETVELKPGMGFAKKVRFRRG